MLALLATWVLLSNLDDLFLDLACLYRWCITELLGRRPVRIPTEADLAAAPQKRIAIFLPLWHEHEVIRTMVEHNLAAHRYGHADFFAGVYPNDERTLGAARELEARFRNVYVSVCPHDGPTSKADNLNWIFQRMLAYEAEHETRFEIVVTHDAEDLIHPEALRWLNYYCGQYDMVQVPVLPLPTPVTELLHGVYCDEFAEYQSRDLPVRQFLGGFLPSCGVGTGFSRSALDRLGAAYGNRIFEPKCLTEDYENGFRLHRLGCSQFFIPLTYRSGGLVATRGYFPRRFRPAVKQRTRWVMGISLQSWEMHGWRETLAQLYWFWRDRKGLIGNLVGPAANGVFLYGVAQWCMGGNIGSPLRLLLNGRGWIVGVFGLSLVMQAIHIALRIRFSARIYGWKFASAVPVRTVLSNYLNALATVAAFQRYFHAKLTRQPLVWLKTEHAYPNRATLMADHRRLGEILVGSQYLPAAELEAALATQPSGVRIGEYLVHLGKLTEQELYESLSLQQNLSFQVLKRSEVSAPVTRALPAEFSRKWKILSFKVAAGQLFVAGPDAPSEELTADLRRFSSLEIRFQLVTPANFEMLEREFLPRPKVRSAGAA